MKTPTLDGTGSHQTPRSRRDRGVARGHSRSVMTSMSSSCIPVAMGSAARQVDATGARQPTGRVRPKTARAGAPARDGRARRRVRVLGTCASATELDETGDPPEPEAGSRITDRYTITELVGSGGMSVGLRSRARSQDRAEAAARHPSGAHHAARQRSAGDGAPRASERVAGDNQAAEQTLTSARDEVMLANAVRSRPADAAYNVESPRPRARTSLASLLPAPTG